METEKPRPYWLDGGTETCGFCSHRHVLQMEYRCTGCDRGACAGCVTVVRETGEVLCSECLTGGDAEEDG